MSVTDSTPATDIVLSIVSTLYLSARSIEAFHERASTAAAGLTPNYEIILVNDGSPDDSLAAALRLRAGDPHLHVVDLSRNFGHHKAMMTGLERARGRLVFLLDSDLEEDPAWLAAFERTLRERNADVVYGVQESRKGGLLERASGLVFYRFFNSLLELPLPRNIVTARLMTRRYVQSLVRHRDREIFMAGLWMITGYLQVPIEVRKQSLSPSTYSLRKRLSVFVNSVTSFSNRPLIHIFYLGCGIMGLSGLAAIYLVVRAVLRGYGVPGWPSLIVSIWFLGGLTIFCLGVIGVYLAKVFSEAKDRPYTIVRAEYPAGSAGSVP